MALTNQTEGNRDQIVIFGGMFGVFASVSALVNSLASHGVRTWRRNFLLPWLAFYLVKIFYKSFIVNDSTTMTFR